MHSTALRESLTSDTFRRITERMNRLAAKIKPILCKSLDEMAVNAAISHDGMLYRCDCTVEKNKDRILVQAATGDEWRCILDISELGEKTGQQWVFRELIFSQFNSMRCLVLLSQGGSDAVAIFEIDVERGDVCDDGFNLPAANQYACWSGKDSILLSRPAPESSVQWPVEVVEITRQSLENSSDWPCLYRTVDSLSVTAVLVEKDGTLWLREVVRSGLTRLYRTRLAELQDMSPIPVPQASLKTFGKEDVLFLASIDTGYPTGSLCRQSLVLGTKTEVLDDPEVHRSISQFYIVGDYAVWSGSASLRPDLRVRPLAQAGTEMQETRKVQIPDTWEMLTINPRAAHPGSTDEHLSYQLEGTVFKKSTAVVSVSDLYESGKLPAPKIQSSRADVSHHEAPSADGTLIPWKIYKTRSFRHGRSPVLVHAYGGYGIPLRCDYNASFDHLYLRRGWAVVKAFIRGGGEFGPDWHEAAVRRNRHRAFEDLAAVVTRLTKMGIARPEKIAFRGRSNGGLLAGVMLTRYSEMFGAIWAQAGIFDMLNFSAHEKGKAWVREFGDPDDPADRAYLAGYSPLENVVDRAVRAYPPIYLETSANDDRVTPVHSRALADRLETAGQPYVLREWSYGGHGGGQKPSNIAASELWGAAFLEHYLGVD
jgi:prolyl oligopeptidase